MPEYIPTGFNKLQQKPPARAQYVPHTWNKHIYVKHIQLATQQSPSPKLNSADTNCVQSINSTFLYYALAVYPYIIPYINKISTFQYVLTQDTMAKYNKVLYYASTHPNDTIRYHASNMILTKDIDDTYLVLPASRSHITVHYCFTKHIIDYSKGEPPINDPILT